jgi:hypothetical protein
VIASALRIASLVAAAILLLSFGMFAIDESEAGAERQVEKLEGNEADPSPRGERAREAENGDVREAIDDANDVLVKPFANVVDSNDIWVQRGVPTLIALLAWGLGVRLLAGYVRF